MPEWFLIERGSVVDGMGNPSRDDTSILVRDDRIFAVGNNAIRERVPRGEPLHVLDASGKTVMPGLIDAHCHASYGESRTQEEQDLYTSVEIRTLRTAWNVKKMLRAGVTSISQPGGSYYIGVGIREGIREGMVLGPRMTTAGRYITTSNGLTDWYPESVGVPESSIGVLANTGDEMIAEVRKQVKNGVDFIKLSDSPFGDYQAFSYEEMRAVSDMAHMLGKRVTIHARGPNELEAAVRAEFDWIMHGNTMTDRSVELLAQSQIPLVPTLLLLSNFAEWGHLVGVPQPVRDGCARMLETTAESLHKAHEAGVTFVTGTDTGFAVTPFGEWHARELELLMEYAGLSPLEAIQAATQNAGAIVDRSGHLGAIAPGMLADILVLNEDPTQNIRVLQDKTHIDTVILGGRILEFGDESEYETRPYDRSLVYSFSELTQDVVYSERPTAPDEMPFTYEEGKDLVSTIQKREASARQSDVT